MGSLRWAAYFSWWPQKFGAVDGMPAKAGLVIRLCRPTPRWKQFILSSNDADSGHGRGVAEVLLILVVPDIQIFNDLLSPPVVKLA